MASASSKAKPPSADGSTGAVDEILKSLNIVSAKDRARIKEHIRQGHPETTALLRKLELSSSSTVATTLSPEELDFITKLESSGGLDGLISAAKNTAQGIGSEQTRQALADLNDASDMCEKAVAALESNRARCIATIESNRNYSSRRAGLQSSKKTSLEEARARLRAMVESEESNIRGRGSQNATHLDSLAGQADSGSGLIGNDVYDRLLEKLQALGREIKHDPNDDAVVEAARYYASLEVLQSVSVCRRLMNSALKEASVKYAQSSTIVPGQADALQSELKATVNEIQSLWDEVVPVAHMAVEKTLLEPILKTVDSKKVSREHQNTIITAYIGNCLDFMNERLEILAKRVEAAIYHHHCLLIALDHQKTFSDDIASGRNETKAHQRQLSSRRDRKIETPAMAYIKKGGEAFGGFPVKVLDPAIPVAKRIAKLDEFVHLRTAKADETSDMIQQLYESTVKTELSDNAWASMQALDALLADSPEQFGQPGSILRDAQTEESLEVLQQESTEIGRVMAKIELPGTDEIAGNPGLPFERYLRYIEILRAGTQTDPKSVEVIQQWK